MKQVNRWLFNMERVSNVKSVQKNFPTTSGQTSLQSNLRSREAGEGVNVYICYNASELGLG